MTEARPGHEVELKLGVRPDDLSRVLRDASVRELAEGRPARHVLLSAYYDTPDLALWRAGLVLRVRTIGKRRIVGVKTRGIARGGLVARDEVEAPLAARSRSLLAAVPEPRLRRALEQATGGARLAPRVTTRFVRHTQRLRVGAALVELALDEGEVRAGRARLPVHELELELLAGPSRALFDVALRIARSFALQPESVGKAERGFARLQHERPQAVGAEPVALPDRASLELALRELLGECLRHLSANRLAVLHGERVEGIHQMRVGTRRLRSALRLFEDWLPQRVSRPLADELRWLAGELGHARDLDVFLEELLGPAEAARPGDAPLVALRRAALAERRAAHAGVQEALGSQRYALLVLRLGRFLEAGGFRDARAPARDVSLRRAARPLLARRHAKLVAAGRDLDRLSPPGLHRLRIQAKRLRYAIDLVGPVFDAKQSTRAVRRLAELQDVLGRLNDLANAERLLGTLAPRLARLSAEERGRATGFVLGFADRSAATAREELERAWRRAARLRRFWEGRP